MHVFLHFIPANDLANRNHGTYKDVISRIAWLQAKIDGYRQVLVHDDDPAEVDRALQTGHVVTGALVEYSYFSRIVKRLKQIAPCALVAVRSINLEPLQHFSNHGWRCSRGPVWMLYGMGRLLAHDLVVKRTADVILSINEWENQVYWKPLPGRAKVEWLPYRCPDHLLPTNPLPYGQRRVIACMPTSQQNRKSWDLVTRFQLFATEMKRLGSRDEFVITGNLRDWNLPDCPEVQQIGFIEDLATFTGRCKAVALLSPLGYGFKTTMADALAAGAHAIMHPILIQRSPDIVKPHLTPFDTETSASVSTVLNALVHSPRGQELHTELCRRAEQVMSQYFGVG